MEEKLLKIIKHYGVLPQLKYFQSEVFELNEAIIKREEDYGFSETTVKMDKENIKHITEEIADVMVMLSQFQEYYGITKPQIFNIMNEKMERQLERIEDEV